MHKISIKACAVLAAAGLALTACSTTGNKQADAPQDSDNKLTIVASTGYLGDAIKNIAPEADLTVLVGPGGDPHTQELTTDDVAKIEAADLVVWTSHDMEHKMMDQFDGLGSKSLPAAEAIPEDQLLPWEEDGQVVGHDPHVWNAPDSWVYAVEAISDKISELDKDNAQTYADNTAAYVEKIKEITTKGREEFAKLPKEKRILVTGHDAFNYLKPTFDFEEILATDLVSSEAQISAKELEELATKIAEHKVPVIFQDNLKNPETVQHLQEAVKAKGWNVEVSDQVLYADTLGEEAPVDTYLGVMEHNIQTIVEALNK